MVSLRLKDLPPALRRQAEAKLKDLPKETKRNKYNARKTIVDGITFASRLEADYYCDLKLLKMAGEVETIELQPEFLLKESFTKKGKKHRAIRYIADFKVMYADGRVEIVDVKPSKTYKTQVYRLKKKLFEARYPELTIKEVYKDDN